MRFKDKVVVVTGGAKGIGKAIVEEFVREGATVIFTHNSSSEEANILVNKLNDLGAHVKTIQVNIKDAPCVGEAINKIDEEYGKIDILINNAGITKDAFLFLMKEEDWKDVIDTNLGGIYNTSKAVLPIMVRMRGGVIVNITSVAGFMGVSGQTNYCSSKAGIIGFTRALSMEVATKNVRVNAIAPGYIDTDMLKNIPESSIKKYISQIPVKRFGTPQDVAKVAIFLASEDASYINGQTIVVDGGLLA